MRKTILWSFFISAVLALALVVVPPMVNLDGIKPQIKEAIFNQTGLRAEIHGSVRLSLLGRATISAQDVVLTDYKKGGRIDYVSFSIPLHKIFNLKSAPIPNEITLSGADFVIDQLATPDFDNTLIIRNSSVTFMGHTYGDINGILKHGMFSGTLRTDEHKYTFDIHHDKFFISNNSINLMITGRLESDNLGRISSSGTLSIDTDRINTWFAFSIPEITDRVALSMKYNWSGMDFHFYDIVGTTKDASFSGEIILSETGKKIKLKAENLNFDLSFIRTNPEFLMNTEFDIDLSGQLTFSGMLFDSLRTISNGTHDGIKIQELAFSGTEFSGHINGEISGKNAIFDSNIFTDGKKLMCDFIGNSDYWECKNWSLTSNEGSLYGTLSVSPTTYIMDITSNDASPSFQDIQKLKRFFGARDGNITFDFKTVAGVVNTQGDSFNLYYASINSSLDTVSGNHKNFLPTELLNTPGLLNVTIADNVTEKINFSSKNWNFIYDKGTFKLTYDDALDLFETFNLSIDTKFLRRNIPISISGKYSQTFISNLVIILGNMEFTGLINKNSVTLKTHLLDMDSLINPRYVANYESERFLTPEPLTVPFMLPFAITLSADYIRYGGNDYANFAYTLKQASQKMSITDKIHGHILLTIDKELARYKMQVQINRFAFQGYILNQSAPLNLSDSMLTAKAELITHGITSYDFWNNVRGDLDLTFESGILSGLGTDWFFANARDITRLNIGDAVSFMLNDGESGLKTLHIIGRYEDNKFETTEPFKLFAKHTEITGNLKISDGRLSAHLDIILRGTSPYPETIYLDIFPDGTRDYSIFEISSKIDPDFLFNFITTHNRF